MKPVSLARALWVALVSCCGLFGPVLLAPSTASAAYTRPFLGEIARAANPSDKPCSEVERLASGSPCLKLSEGGGVALDGEGHLWVGSGTELDEFGPNEFLKSSSSGVVKNLAIESSASGNGEFYLSTAGGVEVFNPNGAYVETWKGFAQPHVAVDNSPETDPQDPSRCSLANCIVYVSTAGQSGGIGKFDSAGEDLPFAFAAECEHIQCGYVKGNEITGPPAASGCRFEGSTPGALAVDSRGDIFVAAPECKSVLEYLPSGEFFRAFGFEKPEVPRLGPEQGIGTAQGVAVDPVTNHLLVAFEASVAGGGHVGAVDEFAVETGKFVGQVSETSEGEQLREPHELAVDFRGDVYVVDQESDVVDVYGEGRELPAPGEVQTEPAEQTATGFKLKGKLNPEGSPTTYYFIYKKSGEVECEDLEGCGPETMHGGPLTGGSEQEVPPLEVTGLTPGVTYVYWLIARNADGTVRSNELTFTVDAQPSIESESVANVTEHEATLEGQINPRGAWSFETTYVFEYGTTTEYGASTPTPPGVIHNGYCGQVCEITTPVPVSETLIGLQPGTTYHYRIVATNEWGTNHGKDATFTTLSSRAHPLGSEEKPSSGGQQTTGGGPSAGTCPGNVATPPECAVKDLYEPKPKPKPLTRAQKLTKALEQCKKEPKRKRAKCDKQAESKYGATAKKHKKK